MPSRPRPDGSDRPGTGQRDGIRPSPPNTSVLGSGGSFKLTIHVKADLGNGQICGETVECAIITRADHFNAGNLPDTAAVKRSLTLDGG